MPIYAYRCTRCGHAKDVLQKISDPVLTDCPACGEATFVKQVTAAGFQLKGSGWYVTDFRGGSNAGKAEGDASKTAKDGDAAAPSTGAEKPADAAGTKAAEAGGKVAPAPAPAAAASPAAPTPPAAAPPSSGS